jgi:hypothetical protein
MEKIKFEDIRIKKVEEPEVLFSKEKEIKEGKTVIKKEKIDRKKVKINSYKIKKSHFEPKNTKIRKSFVACLYLSILILTFFWGSNFFQKAKVSLEVKRQDIDYQSEIFNLNQNSSDYEIMINTEVYEESIGLSSSQKISSKSEGKIKLFNSFSTNSIKLSSGSLLKDDRSYPYVLKKDVTVPGFKSEDGVLSPGEADAEIEAFLAGEVYDGKPTHFTIDSFEGSSKFEKIYGELKDELSGGKEGTIYSLNESDKIILADLAQTKIKDNLIKQVQSLIPEGYLFYPELTNFSYYLNGEITSDKPATKVKIEATLKAVLLKKESLVKYVIKKSIKNIDDKEREEISLNGLEELNIFFKNRGEKITKETNTISLDVSGKIEAIWKPEVEEIKDKLSGLLKEETLSIFEEDRGVIKAKVSIYPPWQKYIPQNKSRIEINLD